MKIITDSRLLIWLSYIPKQFRWLGTVVFIVAGVMVWGFCFFLPLLFRIDTCQKNIITKENACGLLAKKVPHHLEKKFGEPIPVMLVALAKKSHLACSHFVSNVANEYDVGLRGSFHNVLQFLDKLSHITFGLEIEKFFCGRAKKGQLEARLLLGVNKNG